MASCREENRMKLVYIAKIAEQIKRHNDMVVSMKKVAKLHKELTKEERKLLFNGYKNTIESGRVCLQTISLIEHEEEVKGNVKHTDWIRQYKRCVEVPLSNVCRKVVNLIDKHLIISHPDAESSGFYCKLKGDYFWYLAELNTGVRRKKALERAMEAYKAKRSYVCMPALKIILPSSKLVKESDREELVYIAKLAEQAQQYDEMVDAMKKLVMIGVELTNEERYLLSNGYQKLIEVGRVSLRIISSIERKEEAKGNEQHVKWICEYRQEVELVYSKICNDILCMIDEQLIPSASTVWSLGIYYKMKSEFYWYLAEFKTENDKIVVVEQSLKAYEKYEDGDVEEDLEEEWAEDDDEYWAEDGDEYLAEEGDKDWYEGGDEMITVN